MIRTKNVLLGIFCLLTFAAYAQTEESEGTKATVTELKVETDNLDELVNFDWDEIEEMFEGNDTDQEITLSFAYTNKGENQDSQVRINNFEFTVTGKTSELNKLTARLQKSLAKLAEIQESN